MADLTTDQIRSLEQIRQRLLSLNASLGALRTDLATSLPSWTTLQSHSNLISSNLSQVNSQLSEHADLLASTVVFPSMQFPGRHQAEVIQMLLRTKMEPDVEEWVEQGTKYGQEMDSNRATQLLRENDRRELWTWAPRKANEAARGQKWGADYTDAEVRDGWQNVVTGLKRELVVPTEQGDDDEDDEDDDEDFGADDDDDEEADGNVMDIDTSEGRGDAKGTEDAVSGTVKLQQIPVESVHRFMITGKVG